MITTNLLTFNVLSKACIYRAKKDACFRLITRSPFVIEFSRAYFIPQLICYDPLPRQGTDNNMSCRLTDEIEYRFQIIRHCQALWKFLAPANMASSRGTCRRRPSSAIPTRLEARCALPIFPSNLPGPLVCVKVEVGLLPRFSRESALHVAKIDEIGTWHLVCSRRQKYILLS